MAQDTELANFGCAGFDVAAAAQVSTRDNRQAQWLPQNRPEWLTLKLALTIREGEYHDEARTEATELLRLFIAGLSRPSKILKQSWDLLQSVAAEKDSFLQLILRFEWAVGQPGLEQSEAKIRAILIDRGYAENEDQAHSLYEHLLAYVFRRLCRQGRKVLNAAELAEQCSIFPSAARDEELIQLIRAHIKETGARFDSVETTVAKHGGELATLQHAVQVLNRSMGLTAAFTISATTWFRQLDLAPFDLFIWPHPVGESPPAPRSERSPAAPEGRRV